MTVNSIVLCKRRQHLHAIVLGQHYDLTNCSRQKTNWNHSRSITLQCSVQFVHSHNVPYELQIFAAISTNLFHNSHFIRVPKTYFRWGLFICLWKSVCYSSNDLVTTRPPWPTFAEHRDGGQYLACWLRRWWTTFTEIKSRHNFISAH